MAAKQSSLSYICLYYDYLCMFNRLTDKELGKVINALLDYTDDGTEPSLEGGMKGAFLSMRHRMQIDERKYQKRCMKKGVKGSES